MRILIIEDDLQITENLKEILSHSNYLVSSAFNGEEGLYLAETEGFDLLLLDWILPDLTGIEVCKILREKQVTIPILMLTSKSRVEDKVEGLSTGADDYLTKPFIAEELIARVQALIRRKNGVSASPILSIADLEIDLNLCRVAREGRVLNLSPKEYSLLEYLALNQGRVISRVEILEHVWGEEIDPFSNTIDVHIRYLRKKVDDGYGRELIKTIKGKGYLLCTD